MLAMSNRGTTFTLFKNPYIESRLAQMGLREDNVFGCAMDFLFKCACMHRRPAHNDALTSTR